VQAQSIPEAPHPNRIEVRAGVGGNQKNQEEDDRDQQGVGDGADRAKGRDEASLSLGSMLASLCGVADMRPLQGERKT